MFGISSLVVIQHLSILKHALQTFVAVSEDASSATHIPGQKQRQIERLMAIPSDSLWLQALNAESPLPLNIETCSLM